MSISNVIHKLEIIKKTYLHYSDLVSFERDMNDIISELQREEQSVCVPAAVYIPPPPKPVAVYNSCTINVHGCGKYDMAERCLRKSVRDEMVRGMNGARLYK